LTCGIFNKTNKKGKIRKEQNSQGAYISRTQVFLPYSVSLSHRPESIPVVTRWPVAVQWWCLARYNRGGAPVMVQIRPRRNLAFASVLSSIGSVCCMVILWWWLDGGLCCEDYEGWWFMIVIVIVVGWWCLWSGGLR
jgi:hypothetical protein